MALSTTSNLIGQMAVCKTEIRAIELGYMPSRPLMDCRYDIVLDDGDRLWRVQVKHANKEPSSAAGSVCAKLEYTTRTNKLYTYNAQEVDALVVYIPKIDRLCWLPIHLFAGKREITIRICPPKNSQKKGLIMASDYFW